MSVRAERLEPVPQWRHRGGRQHSRLVERALLHHEDRCPVQPLGIQHAPQVLLDLRRRRRLHPVQDHGHRDVPAGGVAQQLPGDGVRVSVGRGHEQPEVRGGEQLARERPVLVGDRVHVRGVQDGQALGDARVPEQHERAGVLHGTGAAEARSRCRRGIGHRAAHPRKVRQHPLGGERPGVPRVVDQQGPPRGRTDGAGARHGVAHQGVDERGLARTRGAAHHREQRCVQGTDPGQDVVVQLGHGAGRVLALLRGARGGQRQSGGAQQVAGLLQRVDEGHGRRGLGVHTVIVPVVTVPHSRRTSGEQHSHATVGRRRGRGTGSRPELACRKPRLPRETGAFTA